MGLKPIVEIHQPSMKQIQGNKTWNSYAGL